MSDTLQCVACGHAEDSVFSVCPLCYTPQPTPTPENTIPEGDASLVVVEVVGDVFIGIDPGSRYTGVAVVDANEKLLASWIFVRPELEKDFIAWGKELISIIDTEVISLFPDAAIGIENVSEPKGFKGGTQSAMNPRDIMRTALIVGQMSVHYKDAVFIKPGRNGSQSDDYYPPELTGRRPKDLLGTNKGAGTRKHEKSAYDVAVKTAKY